MPRNNSYEITKALYQLKRSNSSPILIQRITQTTRDPKTGNRERSIEVHEVPRAIVGGSSVLKRFVYDLSYIAANKNFTTGALFDQYDGLVIVDALDLPKGFQFTHDLRIVNDGNIAEVKSFTQTSDNRAYIVHTKALTTYEPFEFVRHYLNLRGETDAD